MLADKKCKGKNATNWWKSKPNLFLAAMAARNSNSPFKAFYEQLIARGKKKRKRRYLGRYFAHPMMRNRLAKRDDYKASAVLVTQRSMP